MKLAILMYHKIGDDDDVYTVSKERFETHLKIIKNEGFVSCRVKDITKIADEKVVVITFDDGDSSWVEHALPLLRKYGFYATFFVTISLLNNGKLKLGDLQKLKDNNMEIGLHGISHYPLNRLGEEEQKFEISFSRKFLQEQLNSSVISFSFPNGNYNSRIIRLAHESGYRYLCSSKPGYVNDRGILLPRFVIRRDTTENDILRILNGELKYLSRELLFYHSIRISKKVIPKALYELIKRNLFS